MAHLAGSRRLKTLVWDTESLREKGGMDWPEYRKVAGLSVAGTIDGDTGVAKFYTAAEQDDHGFQAMARELEEAATVISYCGKSYDVGVTETVIGRQLLLNNHLDLFDPVKWAMRKEGREWPTGGMKLGVVCQRLFGLGKTEEDGARAPTLWKDGKIGRLLTYCHNDVYILWRLWRHIRMYGYVLDPQGQRLDVRLS